MCRKSKKHRLQRQIRTGRQKRGITSSAYNAAQLQALRDTLLQYTRFSFHTAIHNLCRHNQAAHALVKNAVIAHPTLAVRSLLRKKYIHARGTTKFIEIRPCEPVQNYEILPMKQCTENIPLSSTLHNRSFFGYIDAKTNTIKADSRKQDCLMAGETPICLET